MGAKKTVEKDYAKMLFVNENLSQKEIAERVGVQEKTIGKWINDGNWQSLKTSMLVTKDAQLVALYGQLAHINHEIETRPVVRDIPQFLLKPMIVKDAKGNEKIELPHYNPEDYPIKIGNVATSKDADIIAKITTAIKRLETETNIGETVDVCKKLIQFIQSVDIQLAKKVTDYADAYITSLMK
jgi:transcriptional regulator with XRE-family HTH domain